MTIKPAKDLVFAKPSEKETVVSGFLTTQESAEDPQTAVVVDSGTPDYVKGDVIVYKPYTTTEIKLKGVGYFLIHQEDVLGKVVND